VADLAAVADAGADLGALKPVAWGVPQRTD